MKLQTTKTIEVRFSELDPMQVVWHGAYPLYLEDAREAFGSKFALSYQDYLNNGYFTPIVEMNIQYKSPIFYGKAILVEITYRPTESAKIVFDYIIYDLATMNTIATAYSVQVFTDKKYNLSWDKPEFYRLWQEKWEVFKQ